MTADTVRYAAQKFVQPLPGHYNLGCNVWELPGRGNLFGKSEVSVVCNGN